MNLLTRQTELALRLGSSPHADDDMRECAEVLARDFIGSNAHVLLPEMEGFICSACGCKPAISDASWRWNGSAWEHKCGDAQAGHFPTVREDEL